MLRFFPLFTRIRLNRRHTSLYNAKMANGNRSLEFRLCRIVANCESVGISRADMNSSSYFPRIERLINLIDNNVNIYSYTSTPIVLRKNSKNPKYSELKHSRRFLQVERSIRIELRKFPGFVPVSFRMLHKI